MKILLCCNQGMSTSLVVENMRENAPEGTSIMAVGTPELEDHIEDYDVVLFGPQIKFKFPKLKEQCDEYDKPCDVIDTIAYGRIDGKSILKQAEELLANKG